MKIALCFSGQPRFIEECQDNIKKNLIDGYDVDIFAHGWWHPSYKGRVIAFESEAKFDEIEEASDTFNRVYSPIRSFFEPQIDFAKYLVRYNMKKNFCEIENEIFVKKALFTQLSSLYSIMMADQLLGPERSKYDIVARVRTDLLFEQKVKWENFNSQSLKVSDGRPVAGWGPFCDWFAFGDPNSILAYTNMFNFHYPYNREGLIHIHEFFKCALEVQGVPLEIVNLGCKLYRGHQKDGMHRKIETYTEDSLKSETEKWPHFFADSFGRK